MSTRNSLTHTKKYKLILSAVHMVYRLVNSTYNVSELSLRLARLICQFIKVEKTTVCILEAGKIKLKLKAVFDNKINILLTKKKELGKITAEEKRVLEGYTVFEKHVIGIPLVADDNIGAVLVRRKKRDEAFTEFDKDMLSVVAEQTVTAIKNLQFTEEHHHIILGSIRLIGKLLQQQGHVTSFTHTPNYFKIVEAIAKKLGMSQQRMNCLYYASVLRDAGAIDVPYNILSKSSRLTSEEFKVIKMQPAKSVELIKPVEFLKPVLPIILYRNERYDGTGYPSGLKKEQIPLGARIMALVDAFEAMTKGRPYKTRLTFKEAIAEIKQNSGTQFDPKLVDIFIKLSRQKNFRNILRLG